MGYVKDKLESVEKLKGRDIDLGWDAVKGTIDARDDWWDMKLKVSCSYFIHM